MKSIFIISDNIAFRKSNERFFRYVHGIQVQIVQPEFRRSNVSIPSLYKKISSKIEESFTNKNSSSYQGMIGILDFYDPNWEHLILDDLNPLGGDRSRIIRVLSMLILTFPEIHWLLHTPYKWASKNQDSEENSKRKDYKTIFLNIIHHYSSSSNFSRAVNYAQIDYTPLFDSSSLRNTIKKNISAHTSVGNKEIAPYVPERIHRSASIDDEPEYAWFEAYTAYRFGYRGHAVTSFGLFEDLFKEGSGFKFKPDLIFDDLYLSFSDRSSGISLSDLTKREKNYPFLKETDHHILLTVGHRKGEQRTTWQKNRRYLYQQKIKENTKYKILYKPFAGIFDLWEKSGLKRWLKKSKGLAKGFEWPPKSHGPLDSGGSHSAPGRLLAIAETLIERSRNRLETADTVPKAIHGAMLALEARELLGNRTPTTSLEALSLKQQFEVKAECQFYGVEYNFDVKARIKDIEQEVSSISQWFNKRERTRSALNAEIGILNKLASIYRQNGQFDEENQIMDEMRRLYSKLWSSRKPVRWVLYPFRRYLEILISSLFRFSAAILFWILLFGTIFYLILSHSPEFVDADFGWLDSVCVSAHTLLGFQPPAMDYWGLIESVDTSVLTESISQFWFIALAILGFVHLGIFISHLYLIISRRAGP